MVPPIKYVRTRDGVRIAYWVMGNGQPLVYLPPMPSHIRRDWQFGNLFDLYQSLAARSQLVRIDGRNSGLSDRGVLDLSIEARQLDIEAVADDLGLGDFTVLGHGCTASCAVGFSALHPERVRNLILVDATVGFDDIPETEVAMLLRQAVRADWDQYTAHFAEALCAGLNGGAVHAVTDLLRRSETWPDARRALTTFVHASAFLGDVVAPTLVIHHERALITPVATGIRLTERIADARFAPQGGAGMLSLDVNAVRSAVEEFLREDEEAGTKLEHRRASAPEADQRRTEEGSAPRWDVFISHASEDKDTVARPLALLLISRGLSVWLDENEMKLGDSLRETIDHGLANSRYGVVVLSESFFAKDWPTRELNGLLGREKNDQKVLLPVWHQVDDDYVRRFSPVLADKKAVRTEVGLETVADEIVRAIGEGISSNRPD